MKKVYLKYLFILSLIFIYSCREDIIEPGNVAGNINQPYQEKRLNYLEIVMNARELTHEFIIDGDFDTSENRIFLSVFDRENGVLAVNVLDDAGVQVYRASFEIDVTSISERIRGHVPDKLRIACENFTGKFRIQIARANY